MAEPTAEKEIDLSAIADPDMRRALRTIHHELAATLQRHEMEIQAMLEMILEKHIGSIGEYKRHLLKLQQGGARSERIHDQIHSAVQQPAPSTPRRLS
jgi:hypothetical protein